jgi:predicted metal-dependent peptidase
MKTVVQVSLSNGSLIVTPAVLKQITTEELPKCNKRFEWLTDFIMLRYHFAHYVLNSMTRLHSYTIDTMGVRVTEDGRMELHYNPLWSGALEETELVYVFIHEMMHVILHHCTSRKFDDTELSNVAHDLEINELIPDVKSSCTRPRDENGKLVGCFVSEMKKQKDFSDIEERQTAEWYYNYLRKKQKEGKTGSLGTRIDDHSGHRVNELTSERIRTMVKKIESSKMWGELPQLNVEIILQAQVRKINVWNKIRFLVGNSVAKEKHSTWLRPNRRLGDIASGFKKSYVDRCLVVVDTSGSTWGEGLLGMFLNVLNQLHDDGIPIDFMQVDCQTTQEPKPYDRRRIKLEFKGGGGTSYDPIMAMVEKRRYRIVMILTDGDAPAPKKPRNAKVLWILPAGCNPPVDWGVKIHLQRI